MIKINVIFVHGIELLTFTEKLREIGVGPKFASSVLTLFTLKITYVTSTYSTPSFLLSVPLFSLGSDLLKTR